MADQREPLDVERVGQREDVGNQCVGGIGLDLLRPVAVAEAALVGHDQPETVGQQRRQSPARSGGIRESRAAG